MEGRATCFGSVVVFHIFHILMQTKYFFPLSPGLLDALHPLIAVGLFLCAELQRFLAIVSKYNEKVVLRNRKHTVNNLINFSF